jgi:apolipoprotein N-acyltransferase
MSNDAWFAHPVPAAHQLAITSVRAIENRRWLVRASASGYSAVIDPTGHVVARTTFGQPDTLVAQVHRRGDVTPYQRWGDAPAWSMVTVAIAATLRAWLKRR